VIIPATAGRHTLTPGPTPSGSLNQRLLSSQASPGLGQYSGGHSGPEAERGKIAVRALMRHILALVDRLPERERQVLELCAWDGLSYEDAAGVLDVPVGTIRSRLSRARDRLRELERRSGHERGVHGSVQIVPEVEQ
jgi:DNA-directed RNA polymerase specialized sigma24 family protein